MSILGLYECSWSPWDEDADPDDYAHEYATETLTVGARSGWWSAALFLDDED